VSQKFDDEIGTPVALIPAQAGIQLGTGYFFVFEKDSAEKP
jgi:hypothetical protein